MLPKRYVNALPFFFVVIAGFASTSAHADVVVRPPIQGYAYSIYLFSDPAAIGPLLCNPSGGVFSRIAYTTTPLDHPQALLYCISTIPPTAGAEFGPWYINWSRGCQPGEAYIFVDQTCVSSPNISIPDKDPQRCCDADKSPRKGNPINPANGNKEQDEIDYVGSGAFPLTLKRYYNSKYEFRFGDKPFGANWTSRYFARLTVGNNNTAGCASAKYTQGVGGVWSPDIRCENTVTRSWVYVDRADGSRNYFLSLAGGPFVADSDVVSKLVKLTSTWQYTSANDEIQLYDDTGKLLSITNRDGLTQTLAYDGSGRLSSVSDPFGRQLTFSYDGNNRVATMTESAGGAYTYAYDAAGNLSSVTYPDNTPAVSTDNPKRIYLYNEQIYTANTDLPNALTGITDENGVRFASWNYDASGRAISSEHAGSVEKVTMAYDSPTTGKVTASDYKDSATTVNIARTYTFETWSGVKQATSHSQPCGNDCSNTTAALSYDSNANVNSRTDFNGNNTTYQYDLIRNLETQRVEGLTSSNTTTPQTRTITSEWHANWRLPKRMAEPKRITSYVWNGDGGAYCAPTTALVNGNPIGVLCSKTITETTDANGSLGLSATAVTPANVRTWSSTYNALGQMLTNNGPRTDVTDVTNYTYYATTTASYRIGDLATVTNALGHVTTINSYDANGRPTSITDPNGLVTTMTYTPRGWLATRNVGSLLTQFTYDGVGQLTKATLPDASFVAYTYDPAHRLTDISNAAGDNIHYTLDLMGNRTKEEVKDSLGVVRQQKSRSFDALSRLANDLNAANTVIASYSYDNNGNLKSDTRKVDSNLANDKITNYDYDPLNRLSKITDALAGITQYAYNGVDQLVSVTDPKSLITSYSVDGLDNQKQLVSPDTGTTNNTYDAAGNLKTSTDARAKISTYSYDALNRVTGVTFSDTTPALGYLYDDVTAGNLGKGRLTKLTDGTGNTTFKYDLQGRLIQKAQTTGTVVKTVSYGYDTFGRMSSMTYPSGKVLTYSFDPQGRIASMAVNAVNLVSGITYQPFGVAKSWTWSGGPVQTRNFDLDGRQTSYPYTNTGTVNLAYDLSDRITALTGARAKTYAYDKLDRLTTENTSQTYQYDANGNPR